MNRNLIYLVGMKHTGKSGHGRAAASRLGWSFYDTDLLIQEMDAAATGERRTVRNVYREDGGRRFRQMEAAAVALASSQRVAAVVATGGGVCDNPAAFDRVRRGVCVHLLDGLERLTERVFRSGIPAFLPTADPSEARGMFAELYRRRTAAYASVASVTVQLNGLDEADARALVIQSIEEYLHGR